MYFWLVKLQGQTDYSCDRLLSIVKQPIIATNIPHKLILQNLAVDHFVKLLFGF